MDPAPNVKIVMVDNSGYLEAGFIFFESGIVQGAAIPHIHRNLSGNSMHGEIAGNFIPVFYTRCFKDGS